MRRLIGALLLAAAFLGALPAAATEDNFAGEVPGLAGKTWIDLLAQIFPDIAVTPHGYATASDVIDLRSIGAGDESWIRCGDKINFLDRDARTVGLAGRDYLIVTVLIEDDCVGLLALFDAAGKLVDAVNVKGDQHVSFSGDYVRPLGSDGALVVASLWHDNSSQSYDMSSLVLAKSGGFSSIDDVLAFGSRTCRDQFTEEATIKVAPGTGPMSRIDAEVRREFHRFADDCETKRGREVTTTFNGFWLWNATKRAYEPHTKELQILADWNGKHF